MKSVIAENLIKKIDRAVQDISSFSNISPLESSYLAKFLVVFICGIYEETIETIINERISFLNSPEVSRFIQNSLRWTFKNPKISNISKLLQRFDDSWSMKINQISIKARTAIDSICENKNALAHGNPCNITLNDVIQYYQDSKIIVEEIDNIVL